MAAKAFSHFEMTIVDPGRCLRVKPVSPKGQKKDIVPAGGQELNGLRPPLCDIPPATNLAQVERWKNQQRPSTPKRFAFG
jgi:hypothetical protein